MLYTWISGFCVKNNINHDCDPFMGYTSEIPRWTALLLETAKKAKEEGEGLSNR